jgi:hypothetical protein
MKVADMSDLKEQLAYLKAKRGYLLPHHGLLAITSPHLLKAYDEAYTAIALDMKILSIRDRELVWLAVLIATDEALASHHIPKFISGGGTIEEFSAVVRLTALFKGSKAFSFVSNHWEQHLNGYDSFHEYAQAAKMIAQPLSLRDVWLCAPAVHAALGQLELFEHSMLKAYAYHVHELDLAEALSIMMFPGSVPYFVEAAKIWLSLIRDKKVNASDAFKAWAALEGQGGYDEASRR